MSRKRSHRVVRDQRVPCLVALSIVPEVSIQAHMAIEAIRGGWATTSHFDALAECQNMMTIGMAKKRDFSIKPACELGLMALQNIKARHAETGKIGATGDEINALKAMVSASDDWWPRQAGTLFSTAYRIMKTRDASRDVEVTL